MNERTQNKRFILLVNNSTSNHIDSPLCGLFIWLFSLCGYLLENKDCLPKRGSTQVYNDSG